jgi:hypothetical protein
MKNLSIKALLANIFLAILMIAGINTATGADLPIVETALGFSATTATVQYYLPSFMNGILSMALQTEVWVAGIKDQPVPDTSFVMASTDMSEYVENNILHLAEAGIDPQVFEDYFSGNEDPLPIQDVADIPSEVVLKTYSTAQTRHRQLQEIELNYNRRTNVIGRHRSALDKNLGLVAAHSWTPTQDGSGNKVIKLGENDSVLDGIIDLRSFYKDNDMFGEPLNICLSSEHDARILKEDKKLYKEINSEEGFILYGFRVYGYSKNPFYTAAGVKKPFGAAVEAGDTQATFTWATNEVFRSFGDVDMYANIKDSGIQADTLSFAQRALLGKIRAANPKYAGALI